MNANPTHVLRGPHLVDFDINNPEHLEACRLILLADKQHETLRFYHEPPFINFREMLAKKIVREFFRREQEAKSIAKSNSNHNDGVRILDISNRASKAD